MLLESILMILHVLHLPGVLVISQLRWDKDADGALGRVRILHPSPQTIFNLPVVILGWAVNLSTYIWKSVTSGFAYYTGQELQFSRAQGFRVLTIDAS
jgi:hypothetical protein